MLQRNSPSYKSWMASEESKTEAARCAAQGAALASALQVQFDKIADSLTSRLDNVVGFQNVVGSQGRFRMSSKQPPPDGHSHDIVKPGSKAVSNLIELDLQSGGESGTLCRATCGLRLRLLRCHPGLVTWRVPLKHFISSLDAKLPPR